MTLLEPVRIKRDKLGSFLLQHTTDKDERKAITALLEAADFEAYEKEFLFPAQCPECGHNLDDCEEWQSPKHEELWNVCREIKQLEEAEYHELVPLFTP